MLLAVGFAIDFPTWRAHRLTGAVSGQGAVAHAFLSLEGILTAIAVLTGLFLTARNARGLITVPRNNSMDLVSLFTAWTALQGVVGALLTRLVPGAA